MVSPPTREQCAICGQANESSIETHHIVPQRYGGSDRPENLVKLCGSCHNAIERIYDDGFYRRLGSMDTPAPDLSAEPNQDSELGHEIEGQLSPDRGFHEVSHHVQKTEEKCLGLFEAGILGEGDVDVDTVENIIREEQKTIEEMENQLEGFEEEDPKGSDSDAPSGIIQVEPPSTNNPEKAQLEVDLTNTKSTIEYLEEEYEMGDEIPVNYSEQIELIHCSYCNTAFLEWQAADAAKHLQTAHHINNPYEIRTEQVVKRFENDTFGPNTTVTLERPIAEDGWVDH